MSMDQCNYSVTFEDYTKNHYIKFFKKKYPGRAWEITQEAIKDMCERIDNLRSRDILDKICFVDDETIYKLDFTVSGTHVSAKNSGNRCIVAVNEDTRSVRILLVYHKTHIVGSNETTWWKKQIGI